MSQAMDWALKHSIILVLCSAPKGVGERTEAGLGQANLHLGPLVVDASPSPSSRWGQSMVPGKMPQQEVEQLLSCQRPSTEKEGS